MLSQAKSVTIALAVLSIYAVDFAINVGTYQSPDLVPSNGRSASVLSELSC